MLLTERICLGGVCSITIPLSKFPRKLLKTLQGEWLAVEIALISDPVTTYYVFPSNTSRTLVAIAGSENGFWMK